MRYYGMQERTIQTGRANENGILTSDIIVSSGRSIRS